MTAVDDLDVIKGQYEAEITRLLTEIKEKSKGDVDCIFIAQIVLKKKELSQKRVNLIAKYKAQNVNNQLTELLVKLDQINDWLVEQKMKQSGPARVSNQNVRPYVEGNNIRIWLDLFDNFTKINKYVQDEDIVRALILGIGDSSAEKILQHLKPNSPYEKTYEEVRKLCIQLFEAKINSYTAIVQIFNRVQMKGELVQNFALELSAKADFFEFQNSTERDNILKYRFISGLIDEAIKFELYKKKIKEWTFASAVKAAEAMETTKSSISQSNQINRMQEEKKNKSNKFHKSRNKFRQNKQSFKGKNDKYQNMTCYKCGGKGHGKWQCPTKKQNKEKKIHSVKTDKESDFEQSLGHLRINKLSISSIDKSKLYKTFILLGNSISLEVDTGSPVTTIGRSFFEKFLKGKVHLKPFQRVVTAATGDILPVHGAFETNIGYYGRSGKVTIIVTNTENFLAGTNTLDTLFPRWRERIVQSNQLNKVGTDYTISSVIAELKIKFDSLFNGNLEEPIEEEVVELYIREDIQPIYRKYYQVPFAYDNIVKETIQEQEKKGILVRVERGEWASPIVLVPKPDGSIRICIDPSKTFNTYLVYDHYPLPIIDDLFVQIGGHNWYCLIDLKGAYQQLKVSEKSSNLLIISTHIGLFKYTRMPFGIKPAASIFQKFMDKLLQPLGYAHCYIDDVIIGAKDINEMKSRLFEVLELLKTKNVKVNFDKCKFFVNQVVYLGHTLSVEGLKPSVDKVKAITEFRQPKNISELKSFIGLINYCSKFLQGLNSRAAELYKLLKSNTKYLWSTEHSKVFEEIKCEISKEPFLVHYNSELPIVVTADACDVGIAGTLSHVIDGFERPVFHISRVLTEAEKRYPILHREALALVYSFEKLYKYLYGREFVAYTDHQPLLGIFGKNRKLGPIVTNRLQRYGIRLSIFNFELKYRPGKKNIVADVLSRFPQDEKPNKEDKEEAERIQLNYVNDVACRIRLNMDLIKQTTKKDPLLRQIVHNVMNGWPDKIVKEQLHYYRLNRDLSVENDILVYEGRIVIPGDLQKLALKMLHTGHIGIARMKHIAREYMYWIGMNKEIENCAGACETCRAVNPDFRARVFEPWPKALQPAERVHIDFFHLSSKEYLISVDAYSSWMNIKKMNRTDAKSTIEVLNEMFEFFGDPKVLVADNGPPFSSREFQEFWKNRDVRILHSASYHPQSNGLAERGVQEAKRYLKKMLVDGYSLEGRDIVREFLRLHNFLPNASGVVPAHLIFKFKPRTELEKLREEIFRKGSDKEMSIDVLNNRRTEYFPGEVAYYTIVNDKIIKRIPCTILEKIGNVMYFIKVDEQVKAAHVNQLLKKIPQKEFIPIGLPKEVKANNAPTGDVQVNSPQQKVQRRKRPERLCKPVVRYQAQDFRNK